VCGGRRMNLEKAIKELKELKETIKTAFWNERYIYKKIISIDLLLSALDERYNKGYQDGFKQAKFDCEMDKLDGR
jgi:hypothetical protein